MKREEDWFKMAAEMITEKFDEEKLTVEPSKTLTLVKEIENLLNTFDAETDELLDEKEDVTLSEKYGHRANLPDDQWLEVPKGMTLIEWFYSTRSEGGTENDNK